MANNSQNHSLSNPKIRQKLLTPDPKDYQDFLDMLYNDIDFTIKILGKSKNVYYQGMKDNSKNGEDLINTTICSMLESRGWTARHDTSVNGHADIVVEVLGEPYQWIGEGKIYGTGRTNSYIYKGLKQLLYRYSTGLDDENSGGILMYVNSTGKNQADILNDWKNFLHNKNNETVNDDNEEMPYSPVISDRNCSKQSLAFFTTHKHPSTGLNYDIRHMIIDFRYEPKD